MEEIHEVGTFRSNVAFKSLGIFDNSVQRRGEVRAVSADKYQVCGTSTAVSADKYRVSGTSACTSSSAANKPHQI
jgi:hypothetical protein